MEKSKLKSVLQEITDTCYDGVKGYETAADEINDESIKTLFLRLAQQRKGFIEELRNEALKLGIELESSGSAKGFFHRTWLATKAAFTDYTKDKIIEEAMDGEKKAVEVYTVAYGSQEVPQYIIDILKEQEHLIKVAIHQLNGLFAE
ncbi:MAG TPA: PA2169 family four-helix-bundle protein [Mariniphaga sp.]|nr:PA2169 family four-helix-bundle protein [Mariniphaga sp.]